MGVFNVFLIVICVLSISIGQLLFKRAAVELTVGQGLTAWVFNGWLLTAFFVYGATTLLWVWILRYVPLNVAYPFMALAFIFVPLLSSVFIGEVLSTRVFIGAAFIIIGLLITSGASGG